MKQRNSASLNEALKRREDAERDRRLADVGDGDNTVLALDDTQRVKVLSPGRLVTKRFFKNKLAMVGLGILIFMFLFAFLFPIFYPYSQTQIFYKYDQLALDYANATERTENVSYSLNPDIEIHYSVENRVNSYITEMENAGKSSFTAYDSDGAEYIIDKLGDKVYTLSANDLNEFASYYGSAKVATYDKLGKSFSWNGTVLDEEFQTAASEAVAAKKSSFTSDGSTYTVESSKKNKYDITREDAAIEYFGAEAGADFAAAVAAAVDTGEDAFDFEGTEYLLRERSGGYIIGTAGEKVIANVYSSFVFDAVDPSAPISNELKAAALVALYDSGEFTQDEANYTIKEDADGIVLSSADGVELAALNTFAVRRYTGEDTLSVEFKEKAEEIINHMEENWLITESFVQSIPELDEKANYIYNEDGSIKYVDTDFTVTRNNNSYTLKCPQTTYLIDIYAAPSSQNPFGTDGDGMDILSRMMYGGRISLMVGFVVVIIEMILGIVMGGIAGFFGGWVDTLIMRMVDIFYCIPSMPVLIITGAYLDSLRSTAYVRLFWMMAILGVLGWAGVARLVRGQILSLREQEFMVAEEATGMRASVRIFRHLVPNVMPQLIVSATMGLGSIIITESTLSFLGLGVKHPMASWGTMINSVTGSSEDMIRYAYIWVPVGLLICLTVIAFNFVGDGLRDAFDPKMK